RRTRDQAFWVTAERSVQVPMMGQTLRCGSFHGQGFQAVELPYEGQELSLVVFLPNKRDGLSEFEKGLNPEKLADWLRPFGEGKAEVQLPRFRVRNTLALKETLQGMGMPLAFSDEADFSGMGGQPQDLRLGYVAHQTFVEVNEEGTEAAAAAAVDAKVKSE